MFSAGHYRSTEKFYEYFLYYRVFQKSVPEEGGRRQSHIIYCTSKRFTAASHGLLQPHIQTVF